MIVIYGLLFVYLFLPVIGEFLLLNSNDYFFVEVDSHFFISHFIFSSIIFSSVYYFSGKTKTNLNIVSLTNPKRTISRIVIAMIAITIFIFGLTGYKFLIGGVGRGDLRVSLGIFGVLYSWLVSYFIPILVALGYLCVVSNDYYKIKRKFIIIIILAILCAIFTGYKAVIITTFLPMLTLYFCKKRNIANILKYAVISLSALTLTTSLVRNINIEQAFIFLKYRLLSLTAAGAMGVGQEFPDGVSIDESIKLLYGIFGNKMATVIVGESFSSVEVMKTNLGRYISYLTYDAVDAVQAGKANLTINIFGQAVYIFGYKSGLYVIYAIISAIFIILMLRAFQKNIQNNLLKALVVLAYIYSVIFASLNSGGLTNFIAPTTLVYLIMTYVALLVLIKGKF